MTDFYSVLKSSIVKRDLRSPADRQEVYDQARRAMIRKLWSFDPPLAEDEIDTRIGLFDAAVERIEGDLEIAFAEPVAAPSRPAPRREQRRLPPPEPPRQPLIYEGYDEDTDYAPTFGGRPASRAEREEAPRPAARRRDEDLLPVPRRYNDRWAEPEARSAEPAELRPPPRDNGWRRREPEDERVDDRRAERFYEEAAYSEDTYDEEAAYAELDDRDADYRPVDDRDEPVEWQPAPPADRRAQPRQPANRWDAAPFEDDEPTYDARDDRHAEIDRGIGKQKARKKPAKKSAKKRKSAKASRPRGGGNTVRILTYTIAGLAVVLIAFNAFVFMPVIFGSSASAPTKVAAPPAKIDDRVPGVGETSTPATRIVSDAATASEIPQRNLDVVETLTVFDGRDPTVFEGSPDNPIHFNSDAEGGFARISSSTSAAGARVVIGPGLAERLAGRTIRVTLLARSSQGNGATTIRFAYQSGLAISHWQTATLSPTYGSLGIIWRVPAVQTSSAGDYLLIEPGVPGDGTSTDIRSVKIDILAS